MAIYSSGRSLRILFPVDEEPIMWTRTTPTCHGLGNWFAGLLVAVVALGWSGALADETSRSPVVVKIQDEQSTVVEAGPTGPVDPVQRIRFTPQQLNVNV